MMEIDASNKKNQLINGDCLSVLSGIASNTMDFVLTDPPYITNYKDRSGRSIANDDNDVWVEPAFKQLYRVLKQDSYCVSFYGWSKVDKFFAAWKGAGFRVIGHIVFPKRYTSKTNFLRYQHEAAYLLAKGNPKAPDMPLGDVIDWMYSGNKLHPTQKPLSILFPLIYTFSKPGDVVLDPFCGSGSTLVAARLCGRRYFGIELDAKYHELASNRCSQADRRIEHIFE